MGKIAVDKDKCIGCGMCVSIDPEVFELGSDGKAKAKVNSEQLIVNSKLEEKIKEAVDSCPVKAIETVG